MLEYKIAQIPKNLHKKQSKKILHEKMIHIFEIAQRVTKYLHYFDVKICR